MAGNARFGDATHALCAPAEFIRCVYIFASVVEEVALRARRYRAGNRLECTRVWLVEARQVRWMMGVEWILGSEIG